MNAHGLCVFVRSITTEDALCVCQSSPASVVVCLLHVYTELGGVRFVPSRKWVLIMIMVDKGERDTNRDFVGCASSLVDRTLTSM